MNTLQALANSFTIFLEKTYQLPTTVIANAQFQLNVDQSRASFGDIASNIAMVGCKHVQKKPQLFAQDIVEKFSHPIVEKIEIAGPGFLNFFLKNHAFVQLMQELKTSGQDFFKPNRTLNKKIHVEFVSANPTGPMHVGHGRNGILGDVLANILSFLGNQVHKEFYINDAGAQITKLGISFKIRCLQALGQHIELPEDAYHGEYLQELASQAVKEFGNNLLEQTDRFFEIYAKDYLLQQLQNTLKEYGIIFDEWFSEKYLHEHGLVLQALDRLQKTGTTYEQDGALWFASTQFGDDKDRVLKKQNGELTYVAADIAYLIDKLDRGYDELIMVLGHDHHSYKQRLQGIMQALGYDPKRLNVILYQLVHVLKDGQPVRMSKRTGNMVTLQEIVHEVGKDVARFFFLYRKADAELQFDITLALSQTNENPIYYIQYAYVRTISLQEKATQAGIVTNNYAFQEFSAIERCIIRKIAALPELLQEVAINHQIHILAHYTYELATLLHSYYNQQRIIDTQNMLQTEHNLAIIEATQATLKTCMHIMGITPLNKM